MKWNEMKQNGTNTHGEIHGTDRSGTGGRERLR